MGLSKQGRSSNARLPCIIPFYCFTVRVCRSNYCKNFDKGGLNRMRIYVYTMYGSAHQEHMARVFTDAERVKLLVMIKKGWP